MSKNGNGSTKSKAKSTVPHSRIRETPIAIVGMASLMPDAKALNQYWSNIVEKVNSIVDVPASRWNIDEYYNADPSVPDKTYCKRGAFLPEIDFNPMEYGLPPNILDVTDAGQLLGLVVAKDVLEDAGIGEDSSYDRDRIGCVLGIGGGQKLSASLTARLQYPVIERILRSSGVPDAEIQTIIEKYKANYVPWEENSFPGLLGNVIAGRIANRFNLGGMNSVIDAACASSLSAVKLAVSELLEGHSDVMITGGACADNSIFMYMSFSKTPAFTQDEFIKPFDSESKGMMIGEGIGMIALKRLPDAIRDGDRIYATIRGVGSSSDGKFKSIYAPRPQGQAKALRRAYADAGYAPSTVGLVEAHGTGTAAGDVAEFEGLKEVFGADSPKKQHIALGSVKSQIGHLKAAAGAAGLIKAALALHHKVVPPTLSVEKPNPKMDIENSPFYINAETRPWVVDENGSPRRASVSAFGFGGTNFHVTMEEHTAAQEGAYRLNPVPQPSLLAAKDVAALTTEIRDALSTLESADTPAAFDAFCKATALREIPENHVRIGFVSTSGEEAISLLQQAIDGLESHGDQEAWDTPQGIYFRSQSLDHKGAVVALFSGQGSQYVGMGSELACNFPNYLDSVTQMDGLFTQNEQRQLSDRVFPIPVFDSASKKANEKALQQTQFAQPGIGTFSVGSFKILAGAGFKPDFVAGHSFGELTALWAAGVMSEDAYYRLAKARGEAMAAPDDPDFDAGTMAAIMGDVSTLADNLKDFSDVRIANFNSKKQVVIAGPKDAVKAAGAHLKDQGFKVVALPVSTAFHTPLVSHAQKPFAKAIDAAEFSKPGVPVFSNSSGEAYENSVDSIRTALKDHMLNSVRFTEQLENLHAAGGRIFVEFGPKNVLSPMVANVLADKPHLAIAINPNPKKSSDTQLRLAALQLAVAGIPLSNLDPHSAERRVHNTEKPSPLKIKLSAPNYLSDKFIESRNALMNDGFKLSTATPKVIVQESQTTPASGNGTPSPASPARTGHVDGLDESLALFYQHESETLKIHERYLETPKQYSETFHTLMSKQMDVLDHHPGSAFPEGVERSMSSFHTNQAETLKIHEQFLAQQAETSRSTLNLLKEHHSLLTGTPQATVSTPTPVAAKPQSIPTPTPVAIAPPVETVAQTPPAPVAAPPAAAAIDGDKLKASMLAVVADKTGYPTEMLELDMDMEADLGIDSIKRVEILGAVQEEYPSLPEMNADVMSELRTLGEIVEYMNAQLGAAPAAPVQTPTVNAPAAGGIDPALLKDTMMTVVADKTGYPTDMLELDMDMEADLGIDSIKRVEILGAVQEEYPSLPEMNADVMSELRTLGEIVDYMNAQLGTSPATPAQAPATTAATSGAIDPAQITATMLSVVAEKTGYPTDMLELTMDMEADLGIDSIKRVEILGAVQEEYPDLPELDADVMSDLRTLGDIVNYMNSQIETAAPPAVSESPASTPTSGLDVEGLTQSMLRVVSDKTGYPVDMLELSMDMEADLGIDSIKRVEILGAVQEEYPNLPDVDAELLGEQRTLDDIIQCFLSTSPGSTVPESLIAEVDSLDDPSTVERSAVRLEFVPLPDCLEETVPEDRSYVMTNDGTPLTTSLAEHFVQQGWKVAVLSYPFSADVALPDSVMSVRLENLEESTLADALKSVDSQLGTPERFIHLDPCCDSDDQAKSVLRTTFLLAKHLRDALNQAPTAARSSFVAVARLDGQLGYSGNAFSAIPGGLFGLTKTVNLEWPDVHCRAIDIHPELEPQTAVARILGECADPNRRISEVGHSDSGRAILIPCADTELAKPGTTTTPIDENSVFIVSGGAKGVTAECVVKLAANSGGTYILLGRSAVDTVPSWAEGNDAEADLKKACMEQLKASGEKPTPKKVQAIVRQIQSTRTIQSAVARIDATGGRAHYLSCDVADGDALRTAVSKLTSDTGPITGIIHGAGVLADKVIEKKTAEDFDWVYGPKVDGLHALLSCVDSTQLQHLSLFSSAAGFFGNPAQSDYAIANEILNKSALDFKAQHPGCHVTTFNWGPWDGGMVTPELKKLFAQRNISVIPIGEGSDLFVNDVTAAENSAVQILVGSSMEFDSGPPSGELQRYTITRQLSVQTNPFLTDHCIDGKPVLPMAGVMSWVGSSCESILPGYYFSSLDNMKLLKGIVFLNGDIEQYHLEIVETAKDTHQVTLEVFLWSTSSGNRINHYSATVTLVKEQAAVPVYDSIDTAENDAVDGADYYQNGTLFHGPLFQVIDRGLNASGEKLTLRCIAPDVPSEDQGQFPIATQHLYATDAKFQALLVWARQFKEAGALPTRFGRYEHYREVPAGKTFYLSLDINEATNTRVNGTITLHDEEGRIYSRLIDAETTISKGLKFAAAVS
jgi:acyl transferase domain-containing protein/NAD(P)-dependent dehydrogenase (short-subunit alcohol dehydrogenase family)